MKNLVVVFILNIVVLFTNAQQPEFAPIGAKWWYTLADNTISYPYTTLKYMKIISTKDTIIDDKNCRVLEEYRIPISDNDVNLYLNKIHYIFSDSNKVYYYDFVTESFDILYDFNKMGSEYWLSYLWGYSPDCDTIKIGSIYNTQINGHNLKTLNISQSSCIAGFFFHDYPILEIIGHLRYLFPQADFPIEGPLRCYEDSIIGFYSTGVAPSCDYIGLANINNINSENKINIFPNPFRENFYIELLSHSKSIDVKIFDLLGNCIYEKICKEGKEIIEIDIKDATQGMYILTVNENHFKIIKKN